MSLLTLHELCFNRFFLGCSLSKIQKQVNIFLDKHLSSIVFTPILQRLEKAKKQGAYIAILSNSPDFLVREIAIRMGVDHHLGTRYVVNQKGILVSVTDFVTGKEKADYIAWLYHHGIASEKVTAYSDSKLDIPFLQAAGNRVAVRPDSFLKRVSIRENWEIIY